MRTISLPEDLKAEVRALARSLSTTEEELVRTAVAEKVRLEKARKFRRVTDAVHKGLVRRGIKPEELLEGLIT